MALIKRSVSLHGHRTSLALEPQFWDVVDEAVASQETSLARLIAQIDDNRSPDAPLSSAMRVWALEQVQARSGKP